METEAENSEEEGSEEEEGREGSGDEGEVEGERDAENQLEEVGDGEGEREHDEGEDKEVGGWSSEEGHDDDDDVPARNEVVDDEVTNRRSKGSAQSIVLKKPTTQNISYEKDDVLKSNEKELLENAENIRNMETSSTSSGRKREYSNSQSQSSLNTRERLKPFQVSSTLAEFYVINLNITLLFSAASEKISYK